MFGKNLIGCLAGLAALYLALLAGTLISQEMRAGEESFRKGKASAEAFECEKAIEHFSDAINANPKEPEYFVERARCRTMMSANTAATPSGKWAAIMSAGAVLAVADLDAAIKIAPEYSPAYFERAKVKGLFVGPGDPSIGEITKDYDKAIQLDTGKLEYKHSKARFLLDIAKDERAGLVIYEAMLADRPNDRDVLFPRAHYFLRAKKFEQAIADFTVLIDQKVEGEDQRYERAYSYFELKKYPEALADLNGFIAENTGDNTAILRVAALKLRAEVFRAIKKPALARADEKLAKQLEDQEF